MAPVDPVHDHVRVIRGRFHHHPVHPQIIHHPHHHTQSHPHIRDQDQLLHRTADLVVVVVVDRNVQ